MKHTIETGLGMSDSKRAIEKAMEGYAARFSDYAPRFVWKTENAGEFGFTAKGVSVNGTIEIREKNMDIEMNVPFLFRVFRGRAMKIVTDQVELWVGRVKNGEV